MAHQIARHDKGTGGAASSVELFGTISVDIPLPEHPAERGVGGGDVR